MVPARHALLGIELHGGRHGVTYDAGLPMGSL
jgi:hypothetical protein